MKSSKRHGSKVQLNHLKDGDISYYITYKEGGETKWIKVGKKSEGITEAKCIEFRNQKISESRHGLDLSQQSYKKLTFDKLAELYFSSNAAHCKSNHPNQLMYKKHIKPSLGDVAIAKLDDSLISELQALKKADGKANATNNQYVKLIKRIISFGIKRAIINENPFRNIKLLKVNNTRLRYLSNEEIKRLYELIGNDLILKLFVRIALCTGARVKSILKLQRKDINLEQKILTIKDFKRENHYVGYLDAETYKMLQEHLKYFRANDYVVSIGGVETKYTKLYEKLTNVFQEFNAGLLKNDRANRVVIHTLRHTFASHLAIAGVSIQEIQKLMNHKDIKQTEKYAKLRPDSGREYVENLYKEVS